MSGVICSQCGGGGRVAAKGKVKKTTCRCCKGTGNALDQGRERELAAFLKSKNFSVQSVRLVVDVQKTGSFASYKQ